MLTSAALSCMRNGRKVSVPVAKLSFSTVKKSPRTLNLTGVPDHSRHLPPSLLTSAFSPRLGLTSRSVFISAACHGGTDSQVDPLVQAESESPDQGNFGALSADMSSRRSFRKSSPQIRDLRHDEDGEEEPERPHRRPVRRNTPYWYFLQCKKLIKENKLQEALDLFSGNMLQEERLQPEEFNYSVLIGGCGRAGQLKRAFKLYNDLKKRGLEASDATYTALFNACAESPSKQAGLQQALKLEQELRRKNYPLSTITYHALLKTHAITNHLQACIHTIREMLQNGHVVTQETFHYLLMGCLKDKETGFRLALQVWRQMVRSGIQPDTQNYNLLLRTARDCGIGDPALASRVLLSPGRTYEREGVSHVKTESQQKCLIDIDLLERQLFIQPDPLGDVHHGGRYGEETEEEETYSGKDSSHLVPVRQTVSLSVDSAADFSSAPNLLSVFEGKTGGVVSLSMVDGASDRLALIGGAEGFLEKMEANSFSPDLRTLTLLADTMQPGYTSLQALLKVAKQHKVKLDVAFFNSVIRRAARAGDLEGAKAVLSVMRQRHVSVDVQTFGSLALGCEREKDALQLLKDMEEVGLRPNVQVFSALIGRATRRLDYSYLKTILKTMSTMKVWPNEVIIRQLEFASQYPPNYNQYKSRNNYLIQIDGFRGYYQHWLRYMPAQSAEDEQAKLKTEPDAAVLKTETTDGLTESQRNPKAERKFNTRKKYKTSSSTLQQHS
ncbi:pentatricopeptide repeat-containing protein 1, mitochondrial [Cheilinus undulatus]|uniref:pentatricopeptide repeat-containing protein 1, mitochondrial n=1 Tax=Cheilinus undulatus TaxID=241271 RepID=UPI001BD6BF90|nr:pentatricopeptide repeat-containing protein 1, mitochondrial [Cheilinus undulatus]